MNYPIHSTANISARSFQRFQLARFEHAYVSYPAPGFNPYIERVKERVHGLDEYGEGHADRKQ